VPETRNLHRIEGNSIPCKFIVPENLKHSRPIKPQDLVMCICASFWYKFLLHVSWTCVTPITKETSVFASNSDARLLKFPYKRNKAAFYTVQENCRLYEKKMVQESMSVVQFLLLVSWTCVTGMAASLKDGRISDPVIWTQLDS